MPRRTLRQVSERFLVQVGIGARFSLRDFRTCLDRHRPILSVIDVVREVDHLLKRGLIIREPSSWFPEMQPAIGAEPDFAIEYLSNDGQFVLRPSWLRDQFILFKVLKLPRERPSIERRASLRDVSAEFGFDLADLRPNVTTVVLSAADPRLLVLWKRPRMRRPVWCLVSPQRARLVEAVYRHIRAGETVIEQEVLVEALFENSKKCLLPEQRTRIRHEKSEVSEILAKTRGVRLPDCRERLEKVNWVLPSVPPDLIQFHEPTVMDVPGRLIRRAPPGV